MISEDAREAAAAARPHVMINMAASLDGKINPAARRGPFVMSRHSEDHARMRALRARADAVVIGAGNVRDDDPDLSLAADARALRGRSPLRVLLTTRGEGLRGDEAIFDPTRGGATLVAHARTMPDDTRKRLSARATTAALGQTEVNIARLLALLAASYACRVVLVEGGGALNARFFAARAVDELFLTVVPRVLGGRVQSIVTGDGFAEGRVPDGTLVSAEPFGDELFLHYRFTWPPAPGA